MNARPSMELVCQTGRFLLLVVVLGLLAWAGVGCQRPAGPAGQKYHCPMHPTYITDRPGDCPICGMRLVPIKDVATAGPAGGDSSGHEPSAALAHIQPGQFYCPMHPEVVQDGPGRCPKCDMHLVEKKADEGRPDQPPAPPAWAKTVPGRTMIHLSPEKRQLIGLTLAPVERRRLVRTLRTAAVVEHDETRFYRVAPRFAGWVRKLYVNFTGAPVERGQPMLRVYSPELYAAQNDYLVAWRAWQQLPPDAHAETRAAARALWEAARLRLELLEMEETEIRALEERGQAAAEIEFRAPVSGHVVQKRVVEGQAFQGGETLLEVADLSRLWLRAFVFEMDLPRIAVGQPALVRFPQWPDRTYPARVSFVYPHIEPRTRRAELRLELDNPRHEIRPDMWADVELVLDAGERLAVPASALIDTGLRMVAFVDRGDGHLEPREVQVGWRTEDFYEVRSGLAEGERVVTRALFLVDAESQLKAAMAAMGAHAH
ncbi:efflux RND transporter periplasmic adaptor subunit [Limisphaera sp. VF-2]|uniref:efflux RND transporter periplasmic adaptor subunit n=1 Tax=Limisphaera sp. VF-2 TaxID=3400418 RepID=UPI003C1F6F26